MGKEDRPAMMYGHNRMSRAEAARKGGIAVSSDRRHMAEIGRKGGQSVSRDRDHMARIGERGGAARRGRHN
jgi:general stress protein YciG